MADLVQTEVTGAKEKADLFIVNPFGVKGFTLNRDEVHIMKKMSSLKEIPFIEHEISVCECVSSEQRILNITEAKETYRRAQEVPDCEEYVATL